MAPTSSAVSVSTTLVETVMIVLPIWLAGIRYFIDEFEGERRTKRYFSQMVVLLYVILAGVLVSAGVVLTDLGNNHISVAIYGLWLLFSATGALTFWLLKEKIETDDTPYLLWIGLILAILLMAASFLLMMLTGLKTI